MAMFLRQKNQIVKANTTKQKRTEFSYLNHCIQASVRANTYVCAWDIVANGSRQNAHRDAKLLVAVASISHHDRAGVSLKQA